MVFQDLFTEATDTELSLHTPDVGTSWTRLWSDGVNPRLSVIAASDDLQVTSGGNNSGVLYTADATYPSADYEAQITMVLGNTIATRPFYLIGRLADIENMYAVRGTETASGFQLYKKVAGTWTALGSAVTILNGSVVKLEMIGTAIKVYDDGVEVISVTDSDLTAAGKAGLARGGGAELVTSTDDALTGLTLDVFSVTDLGAGGTTYNQAVAGTLTPAGVVLKSPQLPKAGSLTPAGAVSKAVGRGLAGAMSPAGTLLKEGRKIVAGALSPVGALVTARIFSKALAGALTSAGALAKTSGKALAGGLSSSGALTRQGQKIVGGALSPTGALAKQVGKLVAGALSPAGVLVASRAVQKALSGTLTSSGALTKTAGKSLTGALSPAGTLARQGRKALAGVLASGGALFKTSGKALAGTLSPAGALATSRTVLMALAGALSPTGGLTKQAQKTLAGALLSSGGLTRFIGKALAGALSMAGGLIRTLTGGTAPGSVALADAPVGGSLALTDVGIYTATITDKAGV